MKKLRLFLAILLAIVSASSMKATTYGPLLTAKWGTEAPFNGQCKFEYSGTTYQCQPGPTAIAASMVLYYWKYPTTTVGALDAYIGGLTTGSQTVLYSYPALPAKEFDWDSMKDEYTSYTEAAGVAVAELVRYAGRAQQMNYGVSGSSAKADNVVDMFKKFGYDSGTRLVNKSEYSESAWADLIQGEIKAGRPVVYMAANSSGSSHCFCIDGYNSSDDTYHVNFGWGETYNGWHEMNSFKYDSDDFLFNQNQMAVIGIQPARQPYAVVSDDGLTLTFYYDANKPTGDNVLDLPFTSGHYPATNNKNITTATFDPSFADCHDLTTTNTMFFMCDKLQTINNLEYLNTENVTDMAGMFYGCSSLESLDLSHFDTKNVTGAGMVSMFYECSSLKSLDVSSFEISDGLTDMDEMFAQCTSLETIYCAEGADWSTSGAYKSNMFNGCTSLSGKCGSKKFECDGKNDVDGTYAKAYMGDDDEGGYFTVREPYAVLTDNETDEYQTLTFYYDASKASWLDEVGDANVFDVPWTGTYPGWTSSFDANSTINTVTFDESFKDYHGLTNTSFMFYNLQALTTINHLEYLNTESVTNMSGMFAYCLPLTSLDLGDNFDTSSVTNMYYMFACNYGLKSLDLGDNFDTSSVTNMSFMFTDCIKLESLDLGDNFDTSSVTNMSYMFYNCRALTSLDVSNFNTSSVTNMSRMFNNCYALETIYCAEGTDWSGVNGRTYTNMFAGCSKLSGKYGSKEFSFDSSATNGTYAKVYDGTNGGYFTAISQKPAEAYAVLSSDGTTLTFRYDANKPTTGTVYGIPWGTGDDDYPGWTSSSGNETITTVTFDPSFGDYHGLTSTREMFFYLRKLTAINGIEYLNTENVTDMYAMFAFCNNLEELDLSMLDTKNVTNMIDMFYGCSSLESINLDGKFNTGNVTDMLNMFADCQALTTLDLSSFDTENVKDMSYMFLQCLALESLDVSNFNTENVTDMNNMFYGCVALKELDVSNFDTGNVTDMTYMFSYCSALTELDLSNFDTKKVTNMSYMFENCSQLERIFVSDGWSTESVTESMDMFMGCTNLKGGVQTRFNESDIDAEYACIDAYPVKSGYLTGPSYTVYDASTTTLTFYNDGKRSEKTGTICEMVLYLSSTTKPGWISYSSKVTKVVFDASFKTARPVNMHLWFNLPNLETITNIDYLNTSEVRSMRGTFAEVEKLTNLDLSYFDTSKTKDMLGMFQDCKLEELDLSSFDTQKVTNMESMFEGCSKLKTIYCAKGADWSGVAGRNYTDMFTGCDNLSGKCGSTEFPFDSNATNGTYAKVYDGTNGGYFTYKGNEGYTLEVGEAGMATLYLDYDAVIPEGVEVYYCTGLDDDEAVPTTEKTHAVKINSDNLIPANTGVFVKAAPGEYVFEHPKSGQLYIVASIIGNILTGTLEEKEVGSHSVLTLGYSNQTNDLGFWWYTGTTIPANRAYIPGKALETAEGGVKGIRIVFDDETGIATTNLMNQTNEADAWYSIDGRKLEGKPQQRGLYINNGKKIIIK